MIHKLQVILGVLLLGLLFYTGCEDKKKKSKTDSQPGISKEYKGSAGVLKLQIDRVHTTTDRPIIVSLQAIYPEELKAEFPKAEDKLGGFTVNERQLSEAVIIPQEKKLQQELRWTLMPFLAGDYELPAVAVNFKGTDGKSYKLNAEPVKIKVMSVIPPDEKKPALRDITPVLQLPKSVLVWIIIAAIVVIAVIIVAVIMLLRKAQQEEFAERFIPPHEKALLELEKLGQSDLLRLGKVKEYYQSLSDILRRYIEGRFGLAAPERTTEEFLEYLRNSTVFEAEKKRLLKEFMYHCDLVKFARHEPASNEISAAFASCRNFVVGTAPAQEPEFEDVR